MNYKAEVITDRRGAWATNTLVFATRAEADAYAADLMSRWTLVTDRRSVESDEPVNYRWDKIKGLVMVGSMP